MPNELRLLTPSAEYVQAWALDLIVAIGRNNARVILNDYRLLTNDPKVSELGHKIALERAEILEKLV